MITKTEELVGYFSFDCQPDGYCTFGCGKTPRMYCEPCVSHEMWLEGTPVPDNWHPLMSSSEEPVGICDSCEEEF